MPAWRMAFRDGNKGTELWEQCLDNGVAAIAYDRMEIDLSKYREGEPRERWSHLSGPQRYSLTKFACGIKAGDTIYVKRGPTIVGKGRVLRGYFFDRKSPVEGVGGPWPHLMSVEWDPAFPWVRVQIGDTQLFTIRPLSEADLQKVNGARTKLVMSRNKTEAVEGAALRKEANFRRRNRALIEAKRQTRIIVARSVLSTLRRGMGR